MSSQDGSTDSKPTTEMAMTSGQCNTQTTTTLGSQCQYADVDNDGQQMLYVDGEGNTVQMALATTGRQDQHQHLSS